MHFGTGAGGEEGGSAGDKVSSSGANGMTVPSSGAVEMVLYHDSGADGEIRGLEFQAVRQRRHRQSRKLRAQLVRRCQVSPDLVRGNFS